MAKEPSKKASNAVDFTSRSMPQSQPAEAGVLGSMVIDPECIGEVIEMLGVDSFYSLEHQIIFQAVIGLYEKSKAENIAIDGMILLEELKAQNKLEQVGGTEYLRKVIETVPSSANVAYYAKIVREKQFLREMIQTATEILDESYDESGDVKEKIDKAEQKIFSITNKNISGESASLMDLVSEVYELIEKRQDVHITGLPTGFTELDELTCGLQDGEMTIVAGRPSMGKTALALNIAEHIGVDEKRPLAIFSLEMGKQQLAERFLCSRSRIDAQLVRRGFLREDDYKKLIDGCGELGQSQIYIDDTAGLTPLEIRGKARRLKSRYDIRCIFIDYLQLMSGGAGRIESRQQEITMISRYLKALARELNVPVVVLSQLNRTPETREDHRPRMSDLRESGSIEQDADVIMLLHREDYYHQNDPDYDKDHTAEVIIAKQRNGPTGTVKLSFLEQYTRFEKAASEHIEDPF
jgi:replicative DNA helicase